MMSLLTKELFKKENFVVRDTFYWLKNYLEKKILLSETLW